MGTTLPLYIDAFSQGPAPKTPPQIQSRNTSFLNLWSSKDRDITAAEVGRHGHIAWVNRQKACGGFVASSLWEN